MSLGNAMISRRSSVVLVLMALLGVLAVLFSLVVASVSLSQGESSSHNFIEERYREEKEMEKKEISLVWENPFDISDDKTRFLVTMKDAWYSDEQITRDKRKFYVIYSYKNLGPREGFFSFFDAWGNKAELITTEGHIYEDMEGVSINMQDYYFGNSHWQENTNQRIGGTGEVAIEFWLPNGTIPVELTVQKKGIGIMRFKLPKQSFETKERFKFNHYAHKFEKAS